MVQEAQHLRRSARGVLASLLALTATCLGFAGIILSPSFLAIVDPALVVSLENARNTSLREAPLLLPPIVGCIMALLVLVLRNRASVGELRALISVFTADTEMHPARGVSKETLDATTQEIGSKGLPAVEAAWQTYSATAARRSRGDEVRFVATRDADQAVAGLMEHMSPNWDLPRILRWGTGAAITLGMLGTFLGITEGLGHFEKTGTNAQDVVVGLSSAFWTSIFGLVVGLFISITSGAVQREYELLEEALRRAFERVLPPVAVEQLLFDLLDAQPTSGTEENLNIREEVVGLLSAQREATERLAATASDLADRISDRLTESIEQLSVALRAPVTQAAEAGAQAMKETLTMALQPVVQQMEHFANDLQDFGTEFRGLSEGARDTAQLARDVTQASTEALADATSRFGEVVESLGAFEELTQRVTAAQSELDARLADFDRRALEILERQRSLMEEAHQAAGATVQAAGEFKEASAALSESFDTIGARVEAASTSIETIAASLASSAEQLESSRAGLQSVVEQEQELLRQSVERVDAATAAAQVVAEATTNLGRAVDILDVALPKFGRSAELLDTAADALADLPEATQELAQATETFRTGLRESREAFDGQRDAAENWRKELVSATTSAMQVYDGHLTGAMTGLQVAVKGLEEVAEQVAKAVEEMHHRESEAKKRA